SLPPSKPPHRPGTAPAPGLRAGGDVSPCIADQSSQGVFAMRLSSWLRSARSVLVPCGTENGSLPPRLRKRAVDVRLGLESLEVRTVPSTFTVLNLADGGSGSLRAAIGGANANPGADLIRFAAAARNGTIALTSGQLSVTDDLQIAGPGADRLAVSGNGDSR